MQERQLTHHEQEIFTLLEPVLQNGGYHLVDVVFAKQDGHSHLTVFVFSHENMSVDDMAKISQTLDGVLDHIVFLDDYMLEVSSPGINRIFKNRREFNIFKGLKVKILTVDGQKYIGECEGLNESDVTLHNVETEDGMTDIVIKFDNISKAKLF